MTSGFLHCMNNVCNRTGNDGIFQGFLYVKNSSQNEVPFRFIYNKAVGRNLLCPVNNQDIAVKNPHVHIAGTFNLHENGGRRMLDENVI